ncbi:hypothetical protein JHK85_045768 [Glycine max]|nr:hypothetical protein JHK85_045768 [Glycine max]
MMLGTCKGPISFEDIRTVANIQYPTYREACFAMGFLKDDKEYIETIKEAKDWGTTDYLRKLFVLMLLTGAISKPEEVWNQCWHWLADEIEYRYRKSTVNTSINNNKGGMFFLYRFEGTGKTFIWRTLASSLRAKNQIVIMVASSGIASLLLPGGRIAHSKFKIPVPIFEDSTCNIHQGSQLAQLLNQISLIIWDEASMAHKFCFEALDQSLRDIITKKSSSHQIFGGKVIAFGGDFR